MQLTTLRHTSDKSSIGELSDPQLQLRKGTALDQIWKYFSQTRCFFVHGLNFYPTSIYMLKESLSLNPNQQYNQMDMKTKLKRIIGVINTMVRLFTDMKEDLGSMTMLTHNLDNCHK